MISTHFLESTNALLWNLTLMFLLSFGTVHGIFSNLINPPTARVSTLYTYVVSNLEYVCQRSILSGPGLLG